MATKSTAIKQKTSRLSSGGLSKQVALSVAFQSTLRIANIIQGHELKIRPGPSKGLTFVVKDT